MHLKKKLITFLIYGFGQSINILSPLLVVPFIIAICGIEGLGKISISFSISLILCCIIDYSSTIIGTRDISIHRSNKEYLKNRISDFYLAKLILTIIVTILLFLATITIPFLRAEQKLYLYIIPLLIAQLFNPNWILQGLEKFKWIALINILSKGCYLLAVFFVINNMTDYIWVNFFLGTSNFIFYFIAILFINRSLGINYTVFNLSRAKKLLKTDFRICISEFCLSIYQFFPIVIVGYFLGNSSAGVFRIIEQIISVFRTYIFMFFSFSYPTICYDIQEYKEKGKKTWLIYNLANTILIVLGCLFIYLIKNYVFIFFKVDVSNITTMSSLLVIALFIPIIISISQALRQLLFALEIIKPYTRIIYITTFLNFILMVLFVKLYGLKGILTSTIIIEAIIITSYSYFIQKYNKAILQK